MQALDRSMAIASQAFTALIPLLILVSALAPADQGNLVSDLLITKFGLVGDTASSVELLFEHSADGAIGGLSVVILLLSGVSLTRRLQRMYVTVWRLEMVAGLRGSLNAALALAVLLVEMTLLYLARSMVRGLPADGAVALTMPAVVGILLWTSIPWLLMDRRIPWRRLLPAGILASVAVSVYGQVSALYMPRMMETYSERYGLFGVTLALVGWLLAITILLVAATVVAAELDRSPDRWARRVRAALGLEASDSLGKDEAVAHRGAENEGRG
jgi:membrane protein